MTSFWAVLNWSLMALYNGLWPNADPWGNVFPEGSQGANMANKPLAGGFRGVLWVLKGPGGSKNWSEPLRKSMIHPKP